MKDQLRLDSSINKDDVSLFRKASVSDENAFDEWILDSLNVAAGFHFQFSLDVIFAVVIDVVVVVDPVVVVDAVVVVDTVVAVDAVVAAVAVLVVVVVAAVNTIICYSNSFVVKH